MPPCFAGCPHELKFLEYFLVESKRELVERATSDLLMLERAPSDRERLDGVEFAAFSYAQAGARALSILVRCRGRCMPLRKSSPPRGRVTSWSRLR